MSKTIGILGGMGPEATIYLFNLIVKGTKAEKDQEHITSIVFNNPKIPDRTDAIAGSGPSPLPYLIEGAKILETAGADFIVMPCVTAHYFYDEIVKYVSIPFLHLLAEVLRYIKRELGNLKRFGLLATDGTIQSRLFQDLFNNNGMEVVIPKENDQRVLMKALYQEKGIKGGYKRHPKKMIRKVLKELLQYYQPEGIIAGCTEIPLVLKQVDMDVPFIEPLRILAEESIRKAGYQFRNR
jgi:aspartate racemase